jgi:hypothetical protein
MLSECETYISTPMDSAPIAWESHKAAFSNQLAALERWPFMYLFAPAVSYVFLHSAD